MTSYAFNQGLTHLDKKYPDLFHLNTANNQLAPGLRYQQNVRCRWFNHRNRPRNCLKAFDVPVIIAKQDYVLFPPTFLLKKQLLTFIIILFMLEMAVVSQKGPRDVIHLLATGNVFFSLSTLLYFPPTFV